MHLPCAIYDATGVPILCKLFIIYYYISSYKYFTLDMFREHEKIMAYETPFWVKLTKQKNLFTQVGLSDPL